MPLTRSITVYVPSTKDVSKRISKKEFRKRVRFNERELSGMFGGATTICGEGSYLSKRGKLVLEPVCKVESFATVSKMRRLQPQILKLAREERKAYGQEAISVETGKGRRLRFI